MSEILKPGTPLPWAMSEDLDHNDNPYVSVESKAGHGVIYVSDHAEREDRQDAAYIVTACNAYPDLVEALKLALGELSQAPMILTVEECEELDRVANVARAALAKAGVKS